MEVFQPMKATEQVSRIPPVAHGASTHPEPKVTQDEIVDPFFDFSFNGEALWIPCDHTPFNPTACVWREVPTRELATRLAPE